MNIAQNLQAYLTPLFIVLLISYVLWCVYSMTSKKYRKMFKKLDANIETQRKAVKKLTIAIGLRIAVLVFLVFAYFFAYGPSEVGKDIKPKESGYMEVLKEADGETRTKTELKIDAEERRDATDYLQQVGDEDSLKKEEEENAKKIEETLNKYKTE